MGFGCRFFGLGFKIMAAKNKWAIASILTTAIVASCTPAPNSINSEVEEVASYLVGVMDTSAQAKVIADAPDVRMTACKVRLKETDSSQSDSPAIYLYQEQAMSRNLSAPYRQRFLRLAPSADGEQVESATFKPLAPKKLVGFCEKPEQERVIQMTEMGQKHCSVFLEPADNGYIGETQAEGCPTNYKGAVKITNTIQLNAAGMDTSDRGFDAEGNQIWGAKERPYQFRRNISGQGE